MTVNPNDIQLVNSDGSEFKYQGESYLFAEDEIDIPETIAESIGLIYIEVQQGGYEAPNFHNSSRPADRNDVTPDHIRKYISLNQDRWIQIIEE